MTNRSDPWADIAVPKSDYNARSVSHEGWLPIYWGRDRFGRYLLIIDLAGDYSEQFNASRVSVKGIDIDLRGVESASSQRLVISLEEKQNSDLFYGLCRTMISRLQPVETSSNALTIALQHIQRWKVFLSGKHSKVLSEEEIRGLFGELLFLRFLATQLGGWGAALSSWVGPDGAHQDFQFGQAAAEIKALSGRERNSVRISSEDQLELSTEFLYLVTYHLREADDTPEGKSLNNLVRECEQELKSEDEVVLFSDRLGESGYIEMDHYESPRFTVLEREAFRVEADFPRIIRSLLPDGVLRVKYEVALEKLVRFKCSLAKIGHEAGQ